MEHKLKIWPNFFSEILIGEMEFQCRKNDREFTIGDTILLREYEPGGKGHITGRQARVLVQRVWRNIPGLQEEYCIMKVKLIDFFSELQ